MTLATISVFSWNRFRSRSLYIAPEVVGKRHRFLYDGHRVTISLPTLKMLTPRKELMTQIDHEVLLSYNSWREENGEEHPVAYWVSSVDIVIDYGKPIKVPNGVLDRSPNAYDLVSKKRQGQLNKIANDQEDVARRVFDYWLKIMRWKTDNSSLGRPEVKGHESGWSTYLLDASTRKRFWIGETVIHVSRENPVTLQEWNKVGKLIRNSVHSPLYFDYYYDALEHLALGDLDRCIVDLAVSCETLMRGVIETNLPPNLLDSINKYIDKASIYNYIEDFIPDLLKPIKRGRFRVLKKDIKDLFTERNSILHGKNRSSSNLADCQRFISMTRSLMNLFPQQR